MISLFKRNKEMKVNIERWEYVCVVLGIICMSLCLTISLLWVFVSSLEWINGLGNFFVW